MFSKLIQIILVVTSLSPMLFIFWFKEFSNNWNIIEGVFYLVVAILLFVALKIILNIANKKLEVLPVTINEISIDSNSSIMFIFTYLIPLMNIDKMMMIFLLLLFFIIIFTTNIYYFNPILGLLGYHHYRVKMSNGTNFILITKKTLVHTKQIKNVVLLSNYILLEKK